jgi:hypothetical protein
MSLNDLYESLQKRLRPEDVAETVIEVLGKDLSATETRVLKQATKSSMKSLGWAYSSMSQDFFRAHVRLEPQAKVAGVLFREVPPLTAAGAMDPVKVEEFIRGISGQVHKTFGVFRKLTKAERHALGLFKCTRWYNKRYRFICRMEDKLDRMIRNEKKYLMSRVAKSSLAFRIPQALMSDTNTACLVAYLNARMSMRSVFTNGAQERSFDTISQMLLTRCEKSASTNWLAIAYLMPDAGVVAHLSDSEKAEVLAAYWQVLWESAEILRGVRPTPGDDMIVERGMDSTTWNQAAGAWNKSREHWISLLHALKMEQILDRLLPGKVMRLMAADVARWHQMSGGIHPDTRVWSELPRPWDVLSGQVNCTKDMVEAACTNHGVKPEKWVGPKLNRDPVPFKPTPELVHGVSVASPGLALALRRAGVFSGQGITGQVLEHVVVRDDNGFAIFADELAPSVYT